MMRIDLYKIKKKGMQVAVVTTGALLMSFTSIFAAPVFSVHAEETKEDVEQQKEEAQQAQEEANANAEKYQKKVDKLTAAVNELDKQATDISTQIVEKKQQAEDLQNEIDETQTKLAEAQVSEDNQYEAMKKRIQYLYEEGDVAYIDALMSSASFEDSLNKSEYVDQLSTYDQKQLNKLVKTKNDIAEYQQTLKDDLADVEKVKADLETKQADLDDVISQKNAEINKYSDDVEMQKALAAEYAKQESELDDKLAELARQEQQRLEEELSGGEQQRVAMARALVNNPDIILADEPTGNLDPKNSLDIMNLLEDINKRGTTVVVVTHNKDIVNEMKKRVITLKKGVIISDEKEGGYIDED